MSGSPQKMTVGAAAADQSSRRNRTFFGGVPYPMPTSEATIAIMRANKSRDTAPELALRSALHHAGHRFRVHLSVGVDEGRPVVIDIAFTRSLFAVFVDGCFWHACPDHGVVPRANARYWQPKLARNKERDLATAARLDAAGWSVLRVWEHDPVDRAVDAIEAGLLAARARHALRSCRQYFGRPRPRNEGSPRCRRAEPGEGSAGYNQLDH